MLIEPLASRDLPSLTGSDFTAKQPLEGVIDHLISTYGDQAVVHRCLYFSFQLLNSRGGMGMLGASSN